MNLKNSNIDLDKSSVEYIMINRSDLVFSSSSLRKVPKKPISDPPRKRVKKAPKTPKNPKKAKTSTHRAGNPADELSYFGGGEAT